MKVKTNIRAGNLSLGKGIKNPIAPPPPPSPP